MFKIAVCDPDRKELVKIRKMIERFSQENRDLDFELYLYDNATKLL